MDGGVVCNNPSLDLFLHVKKTVPESQIYVVSIGTGDVPLDSSVSDNSLFWAMNGLSNISIVSQSKETDKKLQDLLNIEGQ